MFQLTMLTVTSTPLSFHHWSYPLIIKLRTRVGNYTD